jgi:alkylation response protein AidB-like acyl-CoA dehydrogenase
MYVVEMQILLAKQCDALVRLAKERGAHQNPLARQELAEILIGVDTFRHTCQRTMSKLLRRGMPGPEASIIKLHWTTLTQAMPQVAMKILGPEGQLYETPTPGEHANPAEWQQAGFLAAPAASIASGTSEILRGIIAMQVLGLKKD